MKTDKELLEELKELKNTVDSLRKEFEEHRSSLYEHQQDWTK